MANEKALAIREKRDTLNKNLVKIKDQIANSLPNSISPDYLIQVIMNTALANPQILECSQASILGAILKTAQYGLIPDGQLGQAYLIPYLVKGVLTCNFQIGYKGLLQLVRRSGNVKSVIANTVYEGDIFEYDLSGGVKKHERTKDTKFEDAAITHFYAIIKYVNGGEDFYVGTKDQIDAHKIKFSKSWKDSKSPWQTSYPAMGEKTALIQVTKYASVSTEAQTAASISETSEIINQKNPAIAINSNIDPAMKEDLEIEYAQEVTEEESIENESKANQAKETIANKSDAALNAAMNKANNAVK